MDEMLCHNSPLVDDRFGACEIALVIERCY